MQQLNVTVQYKLDDSKADLAHDTAPTNPVVEQPFELVVTWSGKRTVISTSPSIEKIILDLTPLPVSANTGVQVQQKSISQTGVNPVVVTRQSTYPNNYRAAVTPSGSPVIGWRSLFDNLETNLSSPNLAQYEPSNLVGSSSTYVWKQLTD